MPRTCAVCGTEWRAALGLFPIHQFGSVHATRVREADLYGARPYATHATQIKGAGIIFKKNNDNAAGTKGAMGDCTVEALCLGSAIVTQAAVKAYTLRHMGLWRLPEPPSLVDRPLLAYSPRPAAELRAFAFRTQVGTQLERHLALLQVQLQDFQAALALAVSLNRSLVLPRVLCSCAFMMWPFFEAANNQNCQPLHLQGLYPRLYECLPSYPFSVPALLRSDLGVRDASALAHPAAADSRLSLLPCVDDGAADGGGARERGFCSPRGRPILPWRPRASEAAAALGSLRHVRVLHFEGVRDAFGGFDSAADAAALRAARRRSSASGAASSATASRGRAPRRSHTGATRCGLCRRSRSARRRRRRRAGGRGGRAVERVGGDATDEQHLWAGGAPSELDVLQVPGRRRKRRRRHAVARRLHRRRRGAGGAASDVGDVAPAGGRRGPARHRVGGHVLRRRRRHVAARQQRGRAGDLALGGAARLAVRAAARRRQRVESVDARRRASRD